jgi:large subunit ribosomal protein L18
VRAKIFGTALRPRLSVFRSARHIFAQAIVDDQGKTIAAVSTLTRDIAEKVRNLKKTEAAREVGKLLSQKLREQGIEAVVFDRGRYLYHGRIKALAEAVRETGLKM